MIPTAIWLIKESEGDKNTNHKLVGRDKIIDM